MAWDFWKKLTGTGPGADAPPAQQTPKAAPQGAEAAAGDEGGALAALRKVRGGMSQIVRLARDPKFRKEVEGLVERMTKDGVDVKDKKAVEAWVTAHKKELGGADQPHVETFVNKEPEVGRNDLCPCGSGKKYKKCHELKSA